MSMQGWISKIIKILIAVTCLLMFCPVLNSLSNCLITGNIECSCSETSTVCSGTQEDLSEIQRLLTNVSSIYSSTDLLDLTLNIKNLTFLPDFTFRDFKLKNLSVGYGLKIVHEDLFSGLEASLSSLNLQYNDIEFISQPLSLLCNLKDLNLDYNDLQEIDSIIFFNLTKLEFLSVSGNNLNSLDSDFLINLPAIQTLVLNNNNFPSISDINIESSSLTKLDAQNCSINEPLKRESLSGVNNLKYIDFSSNHLTGVESFALGELHYLEILNLSNNEVEYLRNNAFSSLYNLVELDLKNNNLSLIEENSFLNLTKLKILDLSENMLEAILYEYTRDLHSLEKINLQNNKIQIITAGTFSTCAHLQVLLLEGNILDCSCELLYFSGFLMNSTLIKPENVNAVICSYPLAMKGARLIDVDFVSMSCEFDEPVSEDYEDDSSEDSLFKSSTLIAATNSTEVISTTTNSMTLTTEAVSTTTESQTSTTKAVSTTTESQTSTTKAVSTTIESQTSLTEAVSMATNSETSTTEATMNLSTSVVSTDLAITTEITSLSTEETIQTSSMGESITNTSTFQVEKTTSIILLSSTWNTSEPIDTNTKLTAIPTNTTVDYSTTEMLTVPVVKTTKLVDSEITVYILDYSVSNENFCIRWNINGSLLSKPTCSVQIHSKKGKKFKNLKCPTGGNEIQECIVSNDVFEFCINIYVAGVRKRKTCSKTQPLTTTKITDSSIDSKTLTHSSTTTEPSLNFTSITSLLTISTGIISSTVSKPSTHPNITPEPTSLPSTNNPSIPFKIIKFDVIFDYVNYFATVIWSVNKYVPNSLCNLTLILTSSNYNYTEAVFNCRNNSYKMQNIKEHETFKVCLVNSYKGRDTLLLCNSSMGIQNSYEVKASRTKDDGYKNSSLIAVICLLIIVMVIIIALVIKNLLKKRTISDVYNVSAEEKNVLRRMSSQYQREPSVRYSYISKEESNI